MLILYPILLLPTSGVLSIGAENCSVKEWTEQCIMATPLCFGWTNGLINSRCTKFPLSLCLITASRKMSRSIGMGALVGSGMRFISIYLTLLCLNWPSLQSVFGMMQLISLLGYLLQLDILLSRLHMLLRLGGISLVSLVFGNSFGDSKSSKRIKIFLWELTHSRLLINEARCQRGLTALAACDGCPNSVEMCLHVVSRLSLCLRGLVLSTSPKSITNFLFIASSAVDCMESPRAGTESF